MCLQVQFHINDDFRHKNDTIGLVIFDDCRHFYTRIITSQVLLLTSEITHGELIRVDHTYDNGKVTIIM